jgi:tetratricopeptide (TPR) repeat protein
MKTLRPPAAALALALLCAGAAARTPQQQLPEPKLAPSPSTDKQRSVIREGISLHDKGDYDGAVRKYEEVLTENPANTIALYEMGYSYSAKGDYRKSLEAAYKGAQYKSDQLRDFYLLIGNNLDLLGKADDAIDVFRRALKLYPDEALLHYNLAITYWHANKSDDAKKSLKSAVAANPAHAGSHLMLASVFFGGGYKTPALLASARFLTLEADSKRAPLGLRIFREVLGGGASQGAKPGEINVVVDVNAKKDEGDFTSVDTVLGLTAAAALSDKGKKTEAERLVSQMETVVSILAEQSEKKSQGAFVYRYYVPYFVEMKSKGYTEAFAYNALRGSGLPGVSEWLGSNSGRVMQFLLWSKNYPWPSDSKQ